MVVHIVFKIGAKSTFEIELNPCCYCYCCSNYEGKGGWSIIIIIIEYFKLYTEREGEDESYYLLTSTQSKSLELFIIILQPCQRTKLKGARFLCSALIRQGKAKP